MPSSKDTNVVVDLTPLDRERLDAWIAARPEPRPSRSQAAAIILSQALESAGARAHPAIADASAIPELPEGAAEPYDGAPM